MMNCFHFEPLIIFSAFCLSAVHSVMSEENISTYQQYVDQLYESAAHGDISGITEALKGISLKAKLGSFNRT
jgi:hypothetical protein